MILKALQNCKFAQGEIGEVNKFQNIFPKKVVQICKILWNIDKHWKKLCKSVQKFAKVCKIRKCKNINVNLCKLKNMTENKGCVYFFRHIGLSPIKIGYSTHESPLDRFNQFKTYAEFEKAKKLEE